MDKTQSSNAVSSVASQHGVDTPADKKAAKYGVPQPELGPAGLDMKDPNNAVVANGYQSKYLKQRGKDIDTNLGQHENLQEMLDQLRDSYIMYKERAARCQMKVKKGATGEQFNRFYYSPKVPFLEEPEKQKQYRKDFLNEVGRMPEPEPLYLIADKLQFDAAEAIGMRNTPTDTKAELAKFYLRRNAQLQHKKHKLLTRWANTQTSSSDLDRSSHVFDRTIGHIQSEQDSCVSRLQRLEPDDKYIGAAEADRPRPLASNKSEKLDKVSERVVAPADEAKQSEEVKSGVSKSSTKKKSETAMLYMESKTKAVASAIRMDDFEVYVRIQTYQNKVNRSGNKLVQELKWLPYSGRYELWEESRKRMKEIKNETKQYSYEMYYLVAEQIKKKLEAIGIQDYKAIESATKRYTYHLEGKEAQTLKEQSISSHISDHQHPYMLFASNCELKFSLMKYAKQYNLNCTQLEIDKGQQFTYQLQSFFPAKFEKQVCELQFDWEDTGKHADKQLLDRLTRTLGLSKVDLLKEMAQYSEAQRRNSILSSLSYDKATQQAEDAAFKENQDNMSLDQFSRNNLLRKIKTIEFFTLDDTPLKLRKADWLDLVCFEPNISTFVVRQNNQLSSKEHEIDRLLLSAFEFTDVNDSSSVNKIIQDSAAAHLSKVAALHKKIAAGQKMNKGSSSTDVHTQGAISSMMAATNPASYSKQPKTDLSEVQQAQIKRYSNIPNVDPLNLNLTKAFYTLRILKTRDLKIKLLHVINYFRAVQRTLCNDLKEFCSREKALGDLGDEIEPHFGKDQNGQVLQKKQLANGPGGIFQMHIQRDLDTQEKKSPHDQMDTITMKAYKYNNRFNPQTMSTCPIIPKHHRTFGKKSLYESVSEQIDNEMNPLNNRKRMESQLITKKDRIIVNVDQKEVSVLNEFGCPILYYETINDMVELEEEMIKIGSYYINQYEYHKAENDIAAASGDGDAMKQADRPGSMIDRAQIANDLYEKELNFQFAKVQVIEQILEAYEHTIDPLDSVRMLQMVVDTMAARPRLNMEATFYEESYKSDTEVMLEKMNVFRSFIELQKEIEHEENDELLKFQEFKFRKIQEHLHKNWEMTNPPPMVERVGSNENTNRTDFADNLKEKLRTKKMKETQKALALMKISEKHITEFANDQYTDFAQVLGLPEITVEDLANRIDQKEPLIIDALRERAFFSKQLEGYPMYFSKQEHEGKMLGLHTKQIGLTDFYCGLSILTKVNAALSQSFEELSKVTTPENGFAASCLENALFKMAQVKVTNMRQRWEENGAAGDIPGQTLIEEDFFLGNSDKLVFAMKEFKSELHPDNLYKRANPLVVASLDVKSVSNFNFPRVLQKEILNQENKNKDFLAQDRSNEAILARMIELAKTSCARTLVNLEESISDNLSREHEAPDELLKAVEAPSMMKMVCNCIEVLRLREELIQRVHETEVLTKIYQVQAGLANKNKNVCHPDSIAFNTQNVYKEWINMIDTNDGSKLKCQLAFTEFDETLTANLDFKSDSCIKALMTDLGVEEMRAILHYQIMQQQILTVAVMINQLIIDGPQRGLKEFELLNNNNITVPNSVLDLNRVLQATSDGFNIQLQKQEISRLKADISKGVDSQMYWILPKKARERTLIGKKFQLAIVDLQNKHKSKTETTLRCLRSYRIKLLHNYCQTVLHEVYQDSLKIQTLQTANELRVKAQLFPRSSQLFHVGLGKVQENLSFQAMQQLKEDFDKVDIKMSIESILTSQVCETSLLYVPTSEEIVMIDRINVADIAARHQAQPRAIKIVEDKVDEEIYEKVRRPHPLNHPEYRLEKGQKYGLRKVDFEEAFSYNIVQYRILMYLTLILRIFNLEYIMGRNNTPGRQILELEQMVFSGRNFWQMVQERSNKQHAQRMKGNAVIDQSQSDLKVEVEEQLESPASRKVIQKILDRKLKYADLSEDILQIKERVERINDWVQNLPVERQNLDYVCDMLILQHQSTYYQFVNGLENILEIFKDKQKEENFQKVMEIHEHAVKKQNGLHLAMKNGYFVTQTSISPMFINLNAGLNSYHDYKDFLQAYQPVIDEKELMPVEVRVLRRIYGHQASLDMQNKDVFMATAINHYANLQTAFYNLDDETRAFIGTNFSQLDDSINDYLIYKGLLEPPVNGESARKSTKGQVSLGKDHEKEKQIAIAEVLGFRIESAHLQRVLMSWICGGRMLPKSTREYSVIQRKFQDQIMMRILKERDQLNQIYWSQSRAFAGKPLQDFVEKSRGFKSGEGDIMSSVNTRSPQFTFINKINLIRAESNVIKRILEVKLIKKAINMIKAEHSALIATFEQQASETVVQAFVHPQQQFASTLYPQVDRNGHLDVVNKLGLVQQFLTRLRNRCTEVETLTSGPGIVFSMKDFNECLQIFCKQLLKYGEEELRTRCETQAMRENQYHHLLYLKEMEGLYYKRKCEQFLQNLDTIINAKMSQKGNQMIYELDVTSRELRTLKDHYYLMEKMLREEIRLDFQTKLSQKDSQIKKLKEDFENFKKQVTLKLQETAAKEIQALDQKVKSGAIGTGSKAVRARMAANNSQQSFGAESQNQDRGKLDPDHIEEILHLSKFIRQQKMLFMVKEVLREERHEKELREQKDKLTQNGTLWEQLAEAEKREQITRQELELTKQNLTHYEKLIDKLHGNVEHLKSQKIRLQQYKDQNHKRIYELENKMKDLEILENIDLNRILEELRSRDKKIEHLTAIDKDFKGRVDAISKSSYQQFEEMKRRFEIERSAKVDAFEKLESMRLEMKALEGKDIKTDLWKDKCKELYEICKDLEQENDELKEGLRQQAVKIETHQQIINNQQIIVNNHTNMKQGVSVSNFNHKGVSKPTLRENMILQRQSLTKPMTAGNNNGRRRVFSGGAHIHKTQGNLKQQEDKNNMYDPGTISSNVSFPAFGSEMTKSQKMRSYQVKPSKTNTYGNSSNNKPFTAVGNRPGNSVRLDSGNIRASDGLTNSGGVLGGSFYNKQPFNAYPNSQRHSRVTTSQGTRFVGTRPAAFKGYKEKEPPTTFADSADLELSSHGAAGLGVLSGVAINVNSGNEQEMKNLLHSQNQMEHEAAREFK